MDDGNKKGRQRRSLDGGPHPNEPWHDFGKFSGWFAPTRERVPEKRSAGVFRLLLLIALALSVLPDLYPALGSEAPGLAELFCTAQVVAQSQGRPVAENDEDWQIISKTLLERRPISDLTADSQPKAKMGECVSKYRSDFEEGEFILRGLDLLELTAHQEEEAAINQVSRGEGHSAKENLLSSKLDQELLAGLLPERDQAPEVEDSSDRVAIHQALQTRRESYLKLWNDFTRKLREKVSHTTIARSTDSTQH